MEVDIRTAMTPREIVAELDQYIIGQDAAKKAVAVALRNRTRRQRLPPEQRDEIMPKNILMIGPTGVGKTEIARRLAQLSRAPFLKVEATKFTEVGYVGRDVESMIRDLVAIAVRLVEKEKVEQARTEAEAEAIERLVDLLEGPLPTTKRQEYDPFEERLVDFDIINEAERSVRREQIRESLLAGKLDSQVVEFDVEEPASPFVQVFTPQGMEEVNLELGGPMGPFGRTQTIQRKVTVAEARSILSESEALRRIDKTSLHKEAVERCEQAGIIFLDELDKVAMSRPGGAGPDVSREGVQRDLLPVIEGCTVATKYGQVRTDFILFIAAGAFHESKPSDLIPELQGRLPIRVQLESLGEEDFRRILREPRNALTTQYAQLLGVEGIELSFDENALDEVAYFAVEVNNKTSNIGARRLHTLMEKLLEDLMFEAPYPEPRSVHVDVAMVRDKLRDLVQTADRSSTML